jgi:hypothetical protein
MLRRDLLKQTMLLGAASLLPLPRLYAAPFAGYSGRLLVTVQCDGGWDVTSFCDPKTNQPGEKEITQWSKSGDIRTAGNIQYAPYANNQSFFENHYQDMLVINGVDMQTNSHTTGVLHNWSGRNSSGLPTLTSLFAANNAPEQPLSYLNFGGFSETAGLIRFSRFQNISNLKNLLEPELIGFEENGEPKAPLKMASEIERIRQFRREKTQKMLAAPTLINRQKTNLKAFSDALSSKGSLKEFKNFLPDSDELKGQIEISNQTSSDLKDQVRLTTAAFESGLTSAADLFIGGFDTHNTHDALHEPLLAFTTDAIQLFWQLAEEKNIADRITMVIGSDFGRTPHYNATEGKDHWPIGSVVVIEKNASWTNRSVGLTDEGHNGLGIDTTTMERDDQNGTYIYPKDVHKALRRHLGIENSLVEQNLTFTNTEDFSFFT